MNTPNASSIDSLTSIRSTSGSSASSDNESAQSFFIDNKQIQFLAELSESKFPVYLVKDLKTSNLQAIKIFPWNEDEEEPSIFFKRETRFSQINHPNVISITDHKTEQEVYSDEVNKVSYILMEYAKNGDLFEALMTLQVSFNETLIRTYFHQMLEGLEALHAIDAAHLDLKLENILLDKKFVAKITDFDLSYMPEDKEINSKGTENYRAPEIITGDCKDGKAADIYSLAIILFLLKTKGRMPFIENGLYNGIDMKSLLKNDPELFWKKHCEFMGKKDSFFSKEFKQLFEDMTQQVPDMRATLKEIKNSEWCNQEIYSQEKVFELMSTRFNLAA